MIARATGTSSAAGRVLDGICDHGVFICIYVSLAFSLGFASWAWLAAVAGLFHAIQSSLYESERARYHRRIRAGVGAPDRIKAQDRSEEHTSELQSLMRISYAVFCLKKKK